MSAFIEARDFLLEHRSDYDAAREGFKWPDVGPDFNWVNDYFDVIGEGNHNKALHLAEEDGTSHISTFDQLVTRSRQVANYMVEKGAKHGDRVLVMLGNETPLWESMLAAIRIGVVMIPATTQLAGDDLADRFERGNATMVITNSKAAPAVDALGANLIDGVVKIVVDDLHGAFTEAGWLDYNDSKNNSTEFTAEKATQASDALLEYFTSGTTSKPKLVRHTHISYPVGHLSTMYWLGLQPGDTHWTISSPGWAKHAWSCFFAPFNAQACVFIYNYTRFDAPKVLNVLIDNGVTTLCAPPTVWRFLIQADLSQYKVALRECISAGEPLNPEVIAQVESAWGIKIRDGFGQTETTAQIGNSTGQALVPGSMGRPLPGYPIVLLDADGEAGDEGEICIDLSDRPVGLMESYADDPDKTADVMRDGYYHTGDVAQRDEKGYITYVGRADDVFKASGYRISPFELESVLIEHPAVAEAAVVPSPDELRGNVPKAYVITAPGYEPSEETAADIFTFIREKVPGFKLIRRIEFGELPKTISGKIRRVELRGQENSRDGQGPRTSDEFIEADIRKKAAES